jgi:heme oxygenase
MHRERKEALKEIYQYLKNLEKQLKDEIKWIDDFSVRHKTDMLKKDLVVTYGQLSLVQKLKYKIEKMLEGN